jgi:hypothetical protein
MAAYRPLARRIEFRRRRRAPDVEAPGIPALAVALVFQTAGGNVVQVAQVSRITRAILVCGIGRDWPCVDNCYTPP